MSRGIPTLRWTHMDAKTLDTLNVNGFTVLQCNECGLYYVPPKLKRFGDQACPKCGDLYPGRVTEETL